MKTLEAYLQANAQLYPDKVAVVCDDCRLSYAQLWLCVQDKAKALCTLDDKALVVRASQSIDFLVTYFAAHLVNKIIVPLEKDATDLTFKMICDTVNSCHIPDNIADILYTTGTTGKQKGTMLSHKAILADAENLIAAQGFATDLTFIICGPLNHIGSLSKIWPSIMVGATIIILEGIKNMDAFFKAVLAANTKVATFLVPASIRMLLQFGKKQLGASMDKFDFIETGAAPIAQADMEALCLLLPNTRLYNTYASTETGIICTHDYNDGYCVAGCLGKPMKHARLNIGEDGMISCQGDTIMSGYVADEQTTNQVLRNGVVYTHDKGRLDAAGRLHLTGREDDIINVGGFKINPVEVEDIAKSHHDVFDCICIADKHPVLGTALRLLVVTAEGRPFDKKSLGEFLYAKLESYKVPQMYSKVDAIKRTYNGKLDRKYYRSNL